MKSVLLVEYPPGRLPFIRSRHRTESAAFATVRGRRFDKLRKQGWTFSVPCMDPGEEFKPEDWT